MYYCHILLYTGLVGRNGTGKTTFLRYMAMHAIDGIPKNCQILHVEQEVVGDDISALQCVLNTDIERTQLLEEEAHLLAQQVEYILFHLSRELWFSLYSAVYFFLFMIGFSAYMLFCWTYWEYCDFPEARIGVWRCNWKEPRGTEWGYWQRCCWKKAWRDIQKAWVHWCILRWVACRFHSCGQFTYLVLLITWKCLLDLIFK